MRYASRRSRLGFTLVTLALIAGACSGSADSATDRVEERSVTVAANPAADEFVVNVTFTESGFEPETVFVPAGFPVRLVLRNRSEHEHHYRVARLVASEVRWIEYPEVDEYEIDSMSTEELRELDPALVGVTDRAELEHLLHHMQPIFSPTKAASLSGIKPLAGEVHGYAQRGESDTLTFFPLTTGRFHAEDVLNPEITGTFVVFLPPGTEGF